jgi:hypothetical protein
MQLYISMAYTLLALQHRLRSTYLIETVAFKIMLLFPISTSINAVSYRYGAALNGSQVSHAAIFTTRYFPARLIKAAHLTTYEAVAPFSPPSLCARGSTLTMNYN